MVRRKGVFFLRIRKEFKEKSIFLNPNPLIQAARQGERK
jgi:hypothetical protein